MERGLKIGLPLAALILGLAIVAPAQVGLWVSTVSGLTTSGTVAVTSSSASALSVTGGISGNPNSTFSTSAAGSHSLKVRNTDSGSTSRVVINVGNDQSDNAGAFAANASGFSSAGINVADGVAVTSNRPGGLSIGANHASGELRFFAGNLPRFTIDAAGRLNSGAAQPGALATGVGQSLVSGVTATVTLGTEVYDEAGNFAGDTFTAPVTGRYLITFFVTTQASEAVYTSVVTLVTSNRSFVHSRALVTAQTDSFTSGSVITDMDAADTAHLTVAITGSAPSTGASYMSIRLMP